MLDLVTGLVLSVNDMTLLIVKILSAADEISFGNLVKNLSADLGENFFAIKDINDLLINLYAYDFILIKRASSKTILLINPNYPFINRFSNPTPPLGLLLLGTQLSNHGYNVEIIDMPAINASESDIISILSEYEPDYIGISLIFSMCHDIVINLTELIKNKYCNKVPIILGGNHATFMAKELMVCKSIDVIVKYQGVHTFLYLINSLVENGYKKDVLTQYDNLLFRVGDEIIDTGTKNTMYDINSIPLFDWNLIKPNNYMKDDRWILYTSIGCTNACHYCSTSQFNGAGRVNSMSVETMINHIKNIKLYALDQDKIQISFVDDAFTFSYERTEKFCLELIEQNINIIWGCSSRVDHLDEKLVRLMYKAGCKAIFFGVESCNDKVLKKANKKTSNESAQSIVKICKDVGIITTVAFILGLPGEDMTVVDLITNYINHVEPKNVNLSILKIYPGTRYWNNPERYGLKVLNRTLNTIETFEPMTETSELNRNQLLQAYIKIKAMSQKTE